MSADVPMRVLQLVIDLPLLTWMDEALCAEVGGDFWFPERGEERTAAAAKRICRQCPVVWECGEYAIRYRIPFGIWGGMTRDERRSASRSRKQAAA